MNYLILGIAAISALCLIIGILLGLYRGLSRSVVRLVLVLVSAVAAWFLRPVIINWILGIEINGRTIESIKDDLIAKLFSGLNTTPASLESLANALVDILLGLVVFMVVFILLALLTYLILFPIIKIFLKKKKSLRWAGALVGLVQGAVVALILCVPITGLVGDLNKITAWDFSGLTASTSNVTAFSHETETASLSGVSLYASETDGATSSESGDSATSTESSSSKENPVAEVLKEAGVYDMIDGYSSSFIGKLYAKTGSPLYNFMTTTTDANGNKLRLSAAIEAAEVGIDLATQTQKIMKAMSAINSEGKTTEENVAPMIESLKALDEIKNKPSEEAAEVLKTVVKDVIQTFASDGVSEEKKTEIAETFDNLGDVDISKIAFTEAADALEVIAKNPDAQDMSNDDVQKIVDGLAANEQLVTILETKLDDGSTLMQVGELDKQKFENAINNTSVSDEYKEKMRKMLGLIESGETTEASETTETTAPDTPSDGEGSETTAA